MLSAFMASVLARPFQPSLMFECRLRLRCILFILIYAECRYVECRGATFLISTSVVFIALVFSARLFKINLILHLGVTKLFTAVIYNFL
jgi:hypothetical protein